MRIETGWPPDELATPYESTLSYRCTKCKIAVAILYNPDDGYDPLTTNQFFITKACCMRWRDKNCTCGKYPIHEQKPPNTMRG